MDSFNLCSVTPRLYEYRFRVPTFLLVTVFGKTRVKSQVVLALARRDETPTYEKLSVFRFCARSSSSIAVHTSAEWKCSSVNCCVFGPKAHVAVYGVTCIRLRRCAFQGP